MSFLQLVFTVFIVAPVVFGLGYFGYLYLKCAVGIVRDFNNSRKNSHTDIHGVTRYYKDKDE